MPLEGERSSHNNRANETVSPGVFSLEKGGGTFFVSVSTQPSGTFTDLHEIRAAALETTGPDRAERQASVGQ